MGLDDTVQVFLNYKSLHRVAARHHGPLVVSTQQLQPPASTCSIWLTDRLYLWGVGVVKHAEDHSGHGVLCVGHVSWRGEGGQVVLQRLTQHAVKSNVGPEDVALLPAVFL